MVDAATGENERLEHKVFVTLTGSMKSRVQKACGIEARAKNLEGMTQTAVLRSILMRAVDAIIEEEEGGLPLGRK